MLMRMTTMKMTTTKTEEDESDDDKACTRAVKIFVFLV